jgi:CheY-like chemotaxis protein
MHDSSLVSGDQSRKLVLVDEPDPDESIVEDVVRHTKCTVVAAVQQPRAQEAIPGTDDARVLFAKKPLRLTRLHSLLVNGKCEDSPRHRRSRSSSPSVHAATSTAPSPLQQPQPSTRGQPSSASPKLRFLIVDDSIVNQKVIMQLLKKAGYGESEFVVCSDGQEALEAVAAQVSQGSACGACIAPFDFIAMDLNMPRMNGWDATKAIRALCDERKVPRPPIVAVTGADRDTWDRCKSCGLFSEALLKPISSDDLQRVVRRFVSQ